jgi:hypothetical protein
MDHKLLFERFLSERRKDLPDIDIDVESARRLEVYGRIFERFGRERVAVTGMPETYRARHALRDTGLALGIAPHAVDRIAKSFPHIRACDIPAALAELPELRQLAEHADAYGPLWELAAGLDALPRGMAMHPRDVIPAELWDKQTELLMRDYPFDRVMAERVLGQAYAYLLTAMKLRGAALGLVPAQIVDIGVHTVILDTVAYAELCDTHNSGNFLHDVPRVDVKQDGSVMRTAAVIAENGFAVDLPLWEAGAADCGPCHPGSDSH